MSAIAIREHGVGGAAAVLVQIGGRRFADVSVQSSVLTVATASAIVAASVNTLDLTDVEFEGEAAENAFVAAVGANRDVVCLALTRTGLSCAALARLARAVSPFVSLVEITIDFGSVDDVAAVFAAWAPIVAGAVHLHTFELRVRSRGFDAHDLVGAPVTRIVAAAAEFAASVERGRCEKLVELNLVTFIPISALRAPIESALAAVALRRRQRATTHLTMTTFQAAELAANAGAPAHWFTRADGDRAIAHRTIKFLF